MERNFKLLGSVLAILALTAALSAAQAQQEASQDDLKVIESTTEATAQGEAQPKLALAQAPAGADFTDPLKYTLGPDDLIEINVLRHPEFSGTFPVNLESKIQYKFVGDIEISGLTKKELEQKIKEIISTYVVNPEVNVTILEYRSKVIYVLGEVGQPGKYYMRSESIPVREAVVQAGLPMQTAAMRKCRIITPEKSGKIKTRSVDLYAVLYGGELRYNIDMHPGDVLYVPCTVMAKLIRMISPVTSTVSGAAEGPAGVVSGKGAVSALVK